MQRGTIGSNTAGMIGLPIIIGARIPPPYPFKMTISIEINQKGASPPAVVAARFLTLYAEFKQLPAITTIERERERERERHTER